MTGRLEPPGHFDDERRGIWQETVDRLTASGRVFRADPEVLITYVEAVRSHRQASRLLAQTNVLITQDGHARENPALAVQRRTAADIGRASRLLGLGRDPVLTPLAASPMQGDGRRWCDEHARDECKHQRKRGGDCHNWHLIAGTGSCRMHVGMSVDRAREAGRLAIARAYGTPLDVAPGEALLDEVRWSAGHVAALRGLVAQLEEQGGEGGVHPGPPGVDVPGQPGRDRSPLWWGVTREVTRDGGVVERTVQAAPHVILTAYNDERRHLLDAARAAVTAGAQAEAIDVARMLGTSVGRLLDAIFARLLAVPDTMTALPGAVELAGWQRAQLPVVVPQVLREFDPAVPP